MLAALRLVGLILVVLGLMLMGADLITSLEKGGQITVRSLDQVWHLVSPTSDAAFKAWVNHTLPTWLAGLVGTVLGFWSWAVLGLPGVALSFLFGRRVADVA